MLLWRVLRRSVRHLNAQGYVLVWANVLWAVLTLPIVTAPLAWAALCHLCHAAQTRHQVTLAVFWEGWRLRWRPALGLGLFGGLMTTINITNLVSFSTGSPGLDSLLRGVWWTALILLGLVLLYAFPILEEMAQPRALSALYNALLLALRHWGLSLCLVVICSGIVMLSTIFLPAWLLLTGSAFATLANAAVLESLRADGYHNPQHVDPLEEIAKSP
ncbi:MAG: hypothetical protein NZ750_06140 [Anaerolineae bacterium]|nr:hypothetical protein [Anaerolineae bacterium]MDW8171665.1 hypothetical protein [Anaerolineae bacterium]